MSGVAEAEIVALTGKGLAVVTSVQDVEPRVPLLCGVQGMTRCCAQADERHKSERSAPRRGALLPKRGAFLWVFWDISFTPAPRSFHPVPP